jgi:hypothetical protein
MSTRAEIRWRVIGDATGWSYCAMPVVGMFVMSRPWRS